MKRKRQEDLISATEISSFAYCPEQWRLEHGLGLKQENQVALHAGTRHHARKAVAERLAASSIDLGRVLIVMAILGLLLLLWLR